MRYIDLHVHSNCSDGTFSPEELVVLGIKQELVAFALTDHDTISGVERAIKKAEEFDNKIQVIPGMELSCKYAISSSQSVEIHMLGYRYDIHNKKLIATLEDISNERDERNRKMCSNLQNAGFPISYDMLCERFGDTILTRAHFARLLLENGRCAIAGLCVPYLPVFGQPVFCQPRISHTKRCHRSDSRIRRYSGSRTPIALQIVRQPDPPVIRRSDLLRTLRNRSHLFAKPWYR